MQYRVDTSSKLAECNIKLAQLKSKLDTLPVTLREEVENILNMIVKLIQIHELLVSEYPVELLSVDKVTKLNIMKCTDTFKSDLSIFYYDIVKIREKVITSFETIIANLNYGDEKQINIVSELYQICRETMSTVIDRFVITLSAICGYDLETLRKKILEKIELKTTEV